MKHAEQTYIRFYIHTLQLTMCDLVSTAQQRHT